MQQDSVAHVASRFWQKVQITDGCWEWQNAKSQRGYGRFMLHGKNRRAHIVAFEMIYGAVPDGLCVCHKCDNPPCVRPDHLFLGSVADNNYDCWAKGRMRILHPCGEMHGRAKLTEDAVRRILLSTDGHRATARQYGVDEALIRQIRSRKIWQNVKVTHES